MGKTASVLRVDGNRVWYRYDDSEAPRDSEVEMVAWAASRGTVFVWPSEVPKPLGFDALVARLDREPVARRAPRAPRA